MIFRDLFCKAEALRYQKLIQLKHQSVAFDIQIKQEGLQIIILTLQKQMDLIEESIGTCWVCAGHSEGQCFCSTLTGGAHQAFEFISVNPQATADPTETTADPTETTADPTETTADPTETTADPTETTVWKRSKKDNIAHKRFTTVLKKVFCGLTGKDIDQEITSHYHRKDYFIMILNLYERENILNKGYQHFLLQLLKFDSTISTKHQHDDSYLTYLKSLIKIYIKAFEAFRSGLVDTAMKIIYDYDNMRQRNKFNKAMMLILKLRKEMGLPF